MYKDILKMEIITRSEAKKQGLHTYFTGKPCIYGHISERRIGGDCIICSKEYYKNNKKEHRERCKKYRENNKEKVFMIDKAYREKNKEKNIKYKRQYYLKNKEKINKKNNENYFENRDNARLYRKVNAKKIKIEMKKYRKTEKGKASKHNSDSKRRSSEKKGDVTTNQLLKLQQNSTHCYWCNTPLKDKVSHVDHYIPLSKGGEHTISNLVMACAKCNLSKGAKMPEEFAMQVGRLL